jgi:hypothetical protein
MPSSRSGWSPTICDHTAPPSMFLGSNAGMSAGDGRTIERRIRISQRGGGSARCSGSRAGFSPEIPVIACRRLQHLQRPTSSHLSPNAPRASRCGDGHMADRRRSRLKNPEPPTLRARPMAMLQSPRQRGDRFGSSDLAAGGVNRLETDVGVDGILALRTVWTQWFGVH